VITCRSCCKNLTKIDQVDGTCGWMATYLDLDE
jgi:hypothetical protein